MSTVVYGLFDNAQKAQRALDDATDLLDDDEGFSGVVHTGHLRPEEVQLAGSEAVRGGIVGSIVVGVAGALIATFMIWPLAGYTFGLEATLLVAVAASMFGGIAGSVAGASECKPAIAARAGQVARGKSLLTCEVDHREDVSRVRACLEEAGATDVQAA